MSRGRRLRICEIQQGKTRRGKRRDRDRDVIAGTWGIALYIAASLLCLSRFVFAEVTTIELFGRGESAILARSRVNRLKTGEVCARQFRRRRNSHYSTRFFRGCDLLKQDRIPRMDWTAFHSHLGSPGTLLLLAGGTIRRPLWTPPRFARIFSSTRSSACITRGTSLYIAIYRTDTFVIRIVIGNQNSTTAREKNVDNLLCAKFTKINE